MIMEDHLTSACAPRSKRTLLGRAKTPRRGVAVFEAILVIPVLVIGVFSIVEFSMLTNRQQHLVEATRNGAAVASQLAPDIITSTENGTVPKVVQQAVNGRLSEAGIGKADIQFLHGARARAKVARTTAANGCKTDLSPLGECVRVEVTVPATELSPNLLGAFGFDISERKYSAASIMPAKQKAK